MKKKKKKKKKEEEKTKMQWKRERVDHTEM